MTSGMRTGRRARPLSGQLAVATRNLTSLRAAPKAGAEQVTQSLIGQPLTVQGGQKDWLFVQTWDTYRAWVQAASVQILEDQSRPYGSTGPVAIIRELFVDVLENPHELAGIITKATISAELEVADAQGDWVGLRLPDGSAGYIHNHQAKLLDRDLAHTMWLPEPSRLIETAARFIGVPYLWGGTSPFGIDCSGFTQLVYRIHNVTLLRDAQMQARDHRALPVEKPDIRAGDLIFFAGSRSSDASAVTHVGLALDNKRFIHSCGAYGVVVTELDESSYQEIYWGARRHEA